ncbi:MAG: sigma-70 family RNA polymerase sigma factor [Gemmatimonadota bacterium]|nr:MAG: sigma-70 family RNA polymerase sigma factor [Gemmatimonadota bacterium]
MTSIAEAVSSGDRSFDDEFREEFDRHFASLFRYLDRLSGDPDLAADVAQEAFIRLYRRGALPARTGSWLVVVARNLYRNARSKSRRRRRLLAGEQVRRAMGDSNPSPVFSLEAAGARKTVRKALDALPEREREILLLRYEGFSYREIAETLELKETSVGTLLLRAKQAFRRALEDSGDHAP